MLDVVALSILMPALKCREALRLRLMEILQPQLDSRVELLVDLDDGETCIGEKRNRLLLKARGEYVCSIDDDDLVPRDYVSRILHAVESGRDCIGFKVRRFSDGQDIGYSVNSLAAQFYHKDPLGDGRSLYWRTPNHLNPIKRELAQRCRFPHQNFGEDAAFAKQVHPLLKTEVFLDECLYEYYYRTPMQRTGERVNG